nr:hypothetical protein [Clostridia bacterium]
NLGDADVNVYGNAEKSYIELINFPKSTYDLSVSQKGINIDNTIGLLSLMRIKENGFSFSGLRHYINPDNYVDKPKMINIYVRSVEEIKAYNFTLDNGNVTFKDLSYGADYSVTIDNGTLTMNNINTSSVINAKIDKGSAEFNTCMADKGFVEIVDGNVNYTFDGLENQYLSASCGSGEVTVNGSSHGDTFTYEPLIRYMSFEFAVKKGDITINASSLNLSE